MNDQEYRASYIQGLHDLALWLKQHPEVAIPDTPTIIDCFTLDTKEEAATLARAMRTFEKSYSDWSFILKKSFGPVMVRYYFTRQNVCTRRVVGVETVPAKFVPAVEAHTIPASTKELVEWDCGSILEVEQELAQEPPND